MKQATLVLGGARSGKSAYAERLAEGHDGEKIYIATAEPTDAEMKLRILYHQARRGTGWRTIDASLALADALVTADGDNRFILIDCVTLWVNNLMFHGRDIESEVARLCEIISAGQARVALVSNEVGSGIVPDNALARAFRDAAGRANQALADAVDEVVLVIAGQALVLKPATPK